MICLDNFKLAEGRTKKIEKLELLLLQRGNDNDFKL